MSRTLVPLVAGAALVSGAILGSFAGAGSGWVPASEGEATYEIESVRLGDETDDRQGRPVTLIDFTTSWPDTGFPGYVTCEARLLDRAEVVVSTLRFEYASFRPSDASGVEVPSGEVAAASAEVVCSAGAQPSGGAGYELSEFRIDSEGDSRGVGPPRLVFHARWTTEDPPLYQECDAALEMPDGEERSYSFGISAGQDQEVEVLLTEEFGQASVQAITCAPFEGFDNR